MEAYKRDFIEFMVRADVLAFGDFTTKSGRRTPYFVNTGRYRTGGQMNRLAAFYAEAIRARLGGELDVLFGPAYKGIPLVVSTAMVLQRDHGLDVSYCFDRKELKDHGEGGTLIGHSLQDGDRVLIVEDVTTAGTSVRGTVPLLRAAADVTLAGLVVSVDRMERGRGDRGALAELAEEFDMPTFAIVDLDEIVEHLGAHDVDGRRVLDEELLERLAAYREAYGARPDEDPV